jgi:hypothetical protein
VLALLSAGLANGKCDGGGGGHRVGKEREFFPLSSCLGPQTASGSISTMTALGRVSPFLMFLLFLCRGSQDPRVAQGPKVTLAGRCSIWLLEALWPWWCGAGHGCPQAEGGGGLGAQELYLPGGP